MALTPLPFFHFTEQYEPRLLDGFEKYVQTTVTPGLQVCDPPAELVNLVEDIIKSLTAFGTFLGLDISPCLTYLNLERIIYAKRNELLKSDTIWNKNILGRFSYNNNYRIYICIDDKDGNNYKLPYVGHTITHEMIHGLAYKEICIDRESELFERKREGLQYFDRRKDIKEYNDTYYLLNEGLTELTALYVIHKFWPLFPSLQPHLERVYSTVSHTKGVLVLKTLMDRILVNSPNQNFEQLLNQAQTDLFTGTRQFMTLVESHCGQEIAGKAANWGFQDEDDPNFLNQIATKFKLDELKNLIIDEDAKTRFSWLYNNNIMGNPSTFAAF